MIEKTVRVGIIGGMSWQSTQSYYQQINSQVSARLGGLHSADLLIHSVDFQKISQWQHENNWEALADALCESARILYQGGARAIAIATNTMHTVAEQVEAATPAPLIHIAEATASRCHQLNASVVGLLGTRFTMEQPFYRDYLESLGVKAIVPDAEERDDIHRIIYDELCKGIINDDSKQRYLKIIERLQAKGAGAVVLGCTEIGLLVNQADTPLPLVDTTTEHVKSIVDRICQK